MTVAPSSRVHAFSPVGIVGATSIRSSGPPSTFFAETARQAPPDSEAPPSIADMRLREIQSELKERNVSYADCFDRESLAKRLEEARDGSVLPDVSSEAEDALSDKEEEKEANPSAESSRTVDTETKVEPVTAESDASGEFDREDTLVKLRSLRVRELKEKLSEMKVRWGTMIEKEEMVQALCQAMEDRFEMGKNFSRSGALVPGTVTDVEESVLIEELGWLEADVNRGVKTEGTGKSSGGGSPHPTILLDVYATWCGPCQFLAPLLVEAAEELGPTVRVVKLDSDKYPRISSVLKVGGLPTLIRFDGGDASKEVQRVEGALTKDQIIDFVNGNFNR